MPDMTEAHRRYGVTITVDGDVKGHRERPGDGHEICPLAAIALKRPVASSTC